MHTLSIIIGGLIVLSVFALIIYNLKSLGYLLLDFVYSDLGNEFLAILITVALVVILILSWVCLNNFFAWLFHALVPPAYAL